MPEVLRHVTYELYNPESGRLDGVRLAEFLDLPTKDVADITGFTDRYVRKDPDAPSFQDSLRKVALIIRGLLRLTGGDVGQVKIWLKAPHPDLEDASPLDLMRGHEIDVVVDLVDDMLSGAPA